MSEAALARNGRDLRDTALGEAELDARLARTWGTAASLIGRLSTVDHKIIGRRYHRHRVRSSFCSAARSPR